MFITPNTLLHSPIYLVYYPYPLLLECKLHECKAFCLFLFMLSTQGRQEDLVSHGCLISICRVNRFLHQADGGTVYYIHEYWVHRERKDPEFKFKSAGIQILWPDFPKDYGFENFLKENAYSINKEPEVREQISKSRRSQGSDKKSQGLERGSGLRNLVKG